MRLVNGYVKSNQYPDALENVRLLTEVTNNTGRYEDTHIRVEDFKMVLDKEPFEAQATFDDLADIRYDIKAKGAIDLEKATHVYPLEGMQVAGKVFADIKSQGRLSYALEGQYDKLPTSGFARIQNFSYMAADLPQGFKITEAYANFSPQTMTIERFDGFLGKSDLQLTGELKNYIAYLFLPEGTIVGNMQMRSRQFDVNEWMTEAPASPTTSAEVKPASNPAPGASAPAPASGESLVVEIPRNVDFTMNAQIDKALYTNLSLDDLKGVIIIRDGVMTLKDVNFNTLGGAFTSNGRYDPAT
ncbi:MAG: hypothetical protein HC880_01930 [Bacteroidia bacterium]|nr:hypothetical protein [Bacteroidia bacterium]